MGEDWTRIAAEVAAALGEVGDISQSSGFPVTLRKTSVTGGVPWDPGSGVATTTDTTFIGVETLREIRDATGTVVQRVVRTLILDATTGVVPSDDDTVAIGVAAEDVDSSTVFEAIAVVRPLAPAGVVILYEIEMLD